MKILPYIITLAAGFVIALLFFKSCSKDPVAPIINPPKELVKKVVLAEKNNSLKVDSLQLLLKKADDRVSKLSSEQRTADRTINILRESIAAIGNKEPSTPTDYEAGKEELFTKIDELNRANDQRDSLCDATVYTLQKSGVLKDSIIELKDKLYSNLRMNFDTAISNNIKLLDFTKQQKKTIRKGKVGVIFWKVVAIAGGAFIIKQSL